MILGGILLVRGIHTICSEKPVNMSDQSVVVKTRKFMKNPLLSRRQVRRWMIAHCRAMLVYFILSSIL